MEFFDYLRNSTSQEFRSMDLEKSAAKEKTAEIS
jgi:hypothetical protein